MAKIGSKQDGGPPTGTSRGIKGRRMQERSEAVTLESGSGFRFQEVV